MEADGSTLVSRKLVVVHASYVVLDARGMQASKCLYMSEVVLKARQAISRSYMEQPRQTFLVSQACLMRVRGW